MRGDSLLPSLLTCGLRHARQFSLLGIRGLFVGAFAKAAAKQGRAQHILNPLIDVQKRFGESRAENRPENRLQTGSPAFAAESVSFAQTRRSSWEVGRR